MMILVLLFITACTCRGRNYYVTVNNLEARTEAERECEPFVLSNNNGWAGKIPVLSWNSLTITKWIEFSDEFCIPLLKKRRIMKEHETKEQFIKRRQNEKEIEIAKKDEEMLERKKKEEENVRHDIFILFICFSLIFLITR